MPTLLGVFDTPTGVAKAVTHLKGRGFTKLDVYSPAPFDEIEEAVDPKPSKVRLFTLVGGLLGVVTGYAMTIWMSLDWPIVIGGKPYASIPPYTVIAFREDGPRLQLALLGRGIRSHRRSARARRGRGRRAAASLPGDGGEPCRGLARCASWLRVWPSCSSRRAAGSSGRPPGGRR